MTKVFPVLRVYTIIWSNYVPHQTHTSPQLVSATYYTLGMWELCEALGSGSKDKKDIDFILKDLIGSSLSRSAIVRSHSKDKATEDKSLLSNRKKIESKFSDKWLFVLASNSSLVKCNPTHSFLFLHFFIIIAGVSKLWLIIPFYK